jgi:metal-sulfur cluster biosynthetic enzyme
MIAPPITEQVVLDTLRQVVDPEIGSNIVDLGLIYDVAIIGTRVDVKMTLTTPGCPMHESICQGAQLALLNLEGVEEANVELVWEPPWHPGMISSPDPMS